MARRKVPDRRSPVSEQILDAEDQTVLDLLDRLLNKGVMLNGEVTLGVAGVDLIYLRLAALFSAADRVFPGAGGKRQRHRVHHGPLRGRVR